MEVAQAENAPYESPRPLQASDLPEGFGTTWRLVPTGTRWSFLEVLRSRTLLIMLAGLIMIGVRYLTVVGIQGIMDNVGDIAYGLSNLAFEDEYRVAIQSFAVIMVFVPLCLAWGMPFAFVLWLVYNWRERRCEPIPHTREVHAYDAQFRWNVLFSSMLGVISFIALLLVVFFLNDLLVAALNGLGLFPRGYRNSDATALIGSYVTLMIAEIPSRRFGTSGDANGLVVERLAGGGYDAQLPERLRSPEGRALVARLLGVGAASTVRGAVLLTRILDVHAAAQDVSEVLGSLLEVLASIVTVGAFARVAGASEEAEAACSENAARGVAFGEPGFVWPQADPSDLKRRNRRTLAFAGLLFAINIILQLLVSLAG